MFQMIEFDNDRYEKSCLEKSNEIEGHNNVDMIDATEVSDIRQEIWKVVDKKQFNSMIDDLSKETRFKIFSRDNVNEIWMEILKQLWKEENNVFSEQFIYYYIENDIATYLENIKNSITNDNSQGQEEANQGQEEANQGQEEANQGQEEANQGQEDSNEENLREIKNLFEWLEKLYNWLSPDLKWRAKLDAELKNKLDGKVDAEQFSQYLFAFNKIQEKQTRWEELNESEKWFLEWFKGLTVSLGIEIAIAIPINSERPKTVEKKLVVRPTSLENIANSDAILENKRTKGFVAKRLENSSSGKVSLSLDNEKDLSRLPKYAVKKFKEVFLRNKDLFDKYKDFINDDWTLKNSDDTLLTAIKEYIAQYEEEKKKDILRKIHERAMIGCFRGLTTYFDINSINQENFIKDIKLNINDDITVDEKNKLYIRWSIKWKNIWIYYNMDDWTVEMDDFLAEDGEWNLFVWANHWKREKLAFTLPTYDSLVDKWWQIDFSGILKKNDREKDIEEQIDKSLDRTMDSSFKNENINKFIVWKHMEEYVAEQEILDHIFQNRLTWANYDPNLDFRQRDIKIEKSNNPNQHKLLSIINNTIEAQKTPNGLQRFRQAIDEFSNLVEKAKDPMKSNRTDCPVFNRLFNFRKMNKWKSRFENNRKTNYQTYFEFMSIWWDSHLRIDLNLLEKANKELTKKGGSLKNINNPIIQEKISEYVEPTADAYLEWQLEAWDLGEQNVV